MNISKEHLETLKENFRLNVYEVKIWVSLLSRGISSAAELADISSVPRSRCYDVLETLEKKGFVIMKIGKPIKYIAVSPTEVLFRVQKEIRSETERVVNATNELKGSETFRELDLLYKTGITHIDPLELASSATGKSGISTQVKGMLERAKSRAALSVGEGKNNSLKNSLKRLKRKGVKITVYAPDKKIADTFKDLGTITIARTPLRFVMIDGKEALFYTTDPLVNPSHEAAVWLNSSFTAKYLETVLSRNLKP
ncbi:TrmB family transcriptional regulator [Candidatus Woesearchaeota archaeon]|nr:TrmB family transcriptional regulator [Candidatus Woesearchaeota archaeon]